MKWQERWVFKMLLRSKGQMVMRMVMPLASVEGRVSLESEDEVLEL